MRKTLKVLAFVAIFSQPLIGIPMGIAFGFYAAETCPVPQEIMQCMNEEIETWTAKLSSLI